jgi:CrcB protein
VKVGAQVPERIWTRKTTLLKNAIRDILIVGSGGFVGSAMRYLVGGWVQNLSSAGIFPYGTIAVNLIGCLVIGFLSGRADAMGAFGSDVRLFLMIGLLGGFTTFSTFGNETMAFLRDRQVSAALANVSIHLIGGLAAVWIGYGLASKWGGAQ